MAGNTSPFPLFANLDFFEGVDDFFRQLECRFDRNPCEKVKKTVGFWEWQAYRLSRSYGPDSPDRKNPAVHISSRCKSRALTT